MRRVGGGGIEDTYGETTTGCLIRLCTKYNFCFQTIILFFLEFQLCAHLNPIKEVKVKLGLGKSIWSCENAP